MNLEKRNRFIDIANFIKTVSGVGVSIFIVIQVMIYDKPFNILLLAIPAGLLGFDIKSIFKK